MKVESGKSRKNACEFNPREWKREVYGDDIFRLKMKFCILVDRNGRK
mgnify:CR=1 FL=1